MSPTVPVAHNSNPTTEEANRIATSSRTSLSTENIQSQRLIF